MIESYAKPARPLLTAEQAAPLSVEGASVALSSGAGCGKTTVLTERFLETLEYSSRLKTTSSVAMTFTEKAARELRKRIREAVHDRLDAASDEDVNHWRTSLRSLEAAPISTFHQFCAGLLRTHALAAGIDPDFEILDATIASTLRSEALSHTIRQKLAESDAGLVELAVEYGMAPVLDGLNVLIDQRGVGSLEEWVDLSEQDVFQIWQTVWETRGRPIALKPLIEAANRCRQWFAAQAFEHPKIRQLGSCLLAELLDFEPQIDRPGRLEWLREKAKMPKGLKKEAWPSIEMNEKTKEVLLQFREAIDDWTAKSDFDKPRSLKAAGHSLYFARLALEARSAFDQAKRRRGGLDFDDLILMMRDLLERDPDLLRKGSSRPIGFILIDEFQDTDPVQSSILRLIAGDSFQTGGMFVVGDFKQSIYGFRGARPDIFTRLREEFPEKGRLTLSENFRSVPGVLDFVNALFAEAFPGEDVRLRPGTRGCSERRPVRRVCVGGSNSGFNKESRCRRTPKVRGTSACAFDPQTSR